MFYWGLDELLAVVGISLCFVATYVTFDMIQVGEGAPRAWYIVVAAFMVLVAYHGARIYFNSSSPDTFAHDVTAALLVTFDLLFLAGATLMDLSFRKRMKAIRSGAR